MTTFRLKTIRYGGNTFPIIMQNENGPCPLLAISNVLLCRGKIKIHPDFSHITSDDLYALLGDYLMKSSESTAPKDPHLRANHEQNVADAIAILPSMLVGLDVNIRFRTTTDFEFTSQCLIFDLLEINLVHGWLMDPQEDYTRPLYNLSYNHIVEKVINYTSQADLSPSSTVVKEGAAAERFLRETASQLTYYGLTQLRQTLKEDELCVFFRNNHFSTLLKHKGDLYLLVTDQGFLHEPHLVWEQLSRIDGNSIFYDSDFQLYDPAKEKVPIMLEIPPESSNDADLDYALAMQLQEEEEEQERRARQPNPGAHPPPSSPRRQPPQRTATEQDLQDQLRQGGDNCIIS